MLAIFHHTIKLLSISLVTLLLFACSAPKYASIDKNFVEQAKMSHKIVVPKGADAPQQQPYYAVPEGAGHIQAARVSLVPPGSNIPHYLKPSTKPSNNVMALQTANTEASQPRVAAAAKTLTLPKKASEEWAIVGRALKKTPYKILDQDANMGSYYVLDVKSTGNQITSRTPIYRVSLKTAGKQTQVSLMDQFNQPANPQVAQRILGALQKQLTII